MREIHSDKDECRRREGSGTLIEMEDCGLTLEDREGYSTNGNMSCDKGNGCLYSMAFIKSTTKWQLLRFNRYIQTLTTFLPLQTWLLYFICLETPDGFVMWNNYYSIRCNTVWDNQVFHEWFFYFMVIWDIFIWGLSVSVWECICECVWNYVQRLASYIFSPSYCHVIYAGCFNMKTVAIFILFFIPIIYIWNVRLWMFAVLSKIAWIRTGKIILDPVIDTACVLIR